MSIIKEIIHNGIYHYRIETNKGVYYIRLFKAVHNRTIMEKEIYNLCNDKVEVSTFRLISIVEYCINKIITKRRKSKMYEYEVINKNTKEVIDYIYGYNKKDALARNGYAESEYILVKSDYID